ncbi:SRPBCC family protein [Streptomyces sp. NPDC018833]|uniref:SRPBCC family protein n=1 Tax=Streptomyces sp. NPDC018833 TaxID=3365053 RepID=UPI0037ACFB2E
MAWIGGLVAVGAAGGAVAGYLGLVTGALPLDVGVGRRSRTLGPQTVDIEAPREVVFDVIAQPYLGRTTRAMREKVAVLERGSDLVLAAHHTPVAGGRLTATTVETVKFTRPERVGFRLVRGPVPAVVESFELSERGPGTRLEYTGEMGTDLWALGQWWGSVVAQRWEATVAASLSAFKQESERRAALPGGRPVNG